MLQHLATILILLSWLFSCQDDEYEWHFDPVCGNGAVDDGEECDAPSLGGETCESLGFTGGILGCTLACTFRTTGCTGGCTDACEAGRSRCRSTADAIESCVIGGNGCTQWWTSVCEDPTPHCVTLDGTPMCHDDPCAPTCTLNDRRCNEDGRTREICGEDPDGCPRWSGSPCPEETPVCRVDDGAFSCSAF